MQTTTVRAEIPVQTLSAPRGRWLAGDNYRWVMLALAMLCVIATFPGQTIGVSVFNEPIREALSLSHSQFALAYMLGTLVGALPLTLLGMLADRYGMKRAVLTGLTGMAAACLLTASARGWTAIFIAFLMLRMLGPGFLSLMSANTLAYWFDRRLGMAEGVRQLGFALAIAVIPSANLMLLNSVGWRSSWMIFAAILLGVAIPTIALLFRNRSFDEGPADGLSEASRKSSTAGLTLGQARRTGAFWGLLVLSVWWGLLGTAIAFNAIPLVKERGFQDADGALLLQGFAVSLGIMHLVAGYLVDRINARFLLAVALCCMSLCCWMLTEVDSRWQIAACGAIMGVGQAFSTGLGSVLCARFFGRLHLGAIRGSIASATVACSATGPFLFGLTFDTFGGFQPILRIAMIVSLLLLAAAAAMRQPKAA